VKTPATSPKGDTARPRPPLIPAEAGIQKSSGHRTRCRGRGSAGNRGKGLLAIVPAAL
jgi:hypothetical protein